MKLCSTGLLWVIMLKVTCVSNWQGKFVSYQFFLSFFLKRGSAIARIVGQNVQMSNRFDPTVKMWVFEEMINGRKLSEIINQEHENVKYLPGYKIPKNVVSWKKITDFIYFNFWQGRQQLAIFKLGSNSPPCCSLPPNSLQYFKYEI